MALGTMTVVVRRDPVVVRRVQEENVSPVHLINGLWLMHRHCKYHITLRYSAMDGASTFILGMIRYSMHWQSYVPYGKVRLGTV